MTLSAKRPRPVSLAHLIDDLDRRMPLGSPDAEILLPASEWQTLVRAANASHHYTFAQSIEEAELEIVLHDTSDEHGEPTTRVRLELARNVLLSRDEAIAVRKQLDEAIALLRPSSSARVHGPSSSKKKFQAVPPPKKPHDSSECAFAEKPDALSDGVQLGAPKPKKKRTKKKREPEQITLDGAIAATTTEAA